MISLHDLEFIARIILASICGLLIGYERQNRSKAAGVRTHCLVACASALMMILSKYAYLDVMEMYGDLMKIDPSRIASGVVSGIGFLGAGTILTHKQTVAGLTTAAGLWATAGVGMAIGSGMYVVGVASAVIVLLIQVILHLNRHGKQIMEEHKESSADAESNLKHLVEVLEECGIQILETECVGGEQDEDKIYDVKASIKTKK